MDSQISITKFLSKLMAGENFLPDESEILMGMILKGELTPSQIAAILTSLRIKGETAEEILGFVKAMRGCMVKLTTSDLVIDTCGTGGDGKNTFNISTVAALVVAGAGVKVAKHGNRSASSKCGSADVMEKLGVNILMDYRQASRCLESVGITFLFAPLYHPSMRNVGLVRKELGIRTVFNFLGPLVNPAGVKRQMLGVCDKDTAGKMAETASKLNYEKLFIFHSMDGMDELSISDKNQVYEVIGDKVTQFIIDPRDYGFKYFKGGYGLRGGDADLNLRIFTDVLSGKKGPERDTVLLNSGAALLVSGSVKTLKEGIIKSGVSIDKGNAEKKLSDLIRVSNCN